MELHMKAKVNPRYSFPSGATYRSDVLHVSVVLAVAVEPGHVEPGAGPTIEGVVAPRHTLLLPDLGDVQLELARHRSVVHDLVIGVGDDGPIVNLIQL